MIFIWSRKEKKELTNKKEPNYARVVHIRLMLNSFNNILPFLKVRSLRAISCGYVESVRNKNNNLRRSGWEDMPTQIMQGIWRNNPCNSLNQTNTLLKCCNVNIIFFWFFLFSEMLILMPKNKLFIISNFSYDNLSNPKISTWINYCHF